MRPAVRPPGGAPGRTRPAVRPPGLPTWPVQASDNIYIERGRHRKTEHQTERQRDRERDRDRERERQRERERERERDKEIKLLRENK